jgi:hypothetical protein
MTHTTKINRIRHNMQMAAYGRTAQAIMASIPDDLFDRISAHDLTIIANALHAAHQAGKAKAEADVLDEGAIYSPKAGRMIELAK